MRHFEFKERSDPSGWGRLSRTAALVTWRLRAVVHSAPLSAAITGKVYTKEDISFRFAKEKERLCIMGI